MNVLRFEEYSNLINEEKEHGREEAIKIDLNDDEAEIEINKRYDFLGVEFVPMYKIPVDKNDEPYTTIIRKPGTKEGKELYWGKVIKAKSLEELQNEIRVEIKFYLEDNDMKA